ncbi:Ku protein [Streptomyces sp. NPDC050982]|uniref:Ku protein n=1 Tax=Streptomyces sp. NPDC050982 TaxID=3154746 RepID=UPI0033FCC11A
MARAVWSGVLTFGLVTVPVQLFTATDTHAIHFHQLQRGTSDRVRNKRVNERTGEEAPFDEIVKGFDTGEGEYVIVDPDALDDIAPVFFDRTYYLGPRGKGYRKVYALLHRALEKVQKAGISTRQCESHRQGIAHGQTAHRLAQHRVEARGMA